MERLTVFFFFASLLTGGAMGLTGEGSSSYGSSGYGAPSYAQVSPTNVVSTGNGYKTGMSVSNTNTGNFNLSTPQGVMAFVNAEGINPNILVTSNCIPNGNPCTPTGQVCCLSPVFGCLGSPGTCMVTPGHVNHIPQIRQILRTVGYTTQNPIL